MTRDCFGQGSRPTPLSVIGRSRGGRSGSEVLGRRHGDVPRQSMSRAGRSARAYAAFLAVPALTR